MSTGALYIHQGAASGHEADDTMLLAGLDWTAPGKAGRVARPRAGTAYLEWRGSCAVVQPGRGRHAGVTAAASTEGAGALLAQMCLAAEAGGDAAGAADTGGLWIWIARVYETGNPDRPARWWLGGTTDGAPAQAVPEELHETLAGLVRAVAAIAATSQLAGTGVCVSVVDDVQTALEPHGPELPAPVICTPKPPGEGNPRFAMPEPRPFVRAVAATAVTVMLTVGAWAGGLIGNNEPEPSVIVHTAPVAGAVRAACMSGLDASFPRLPGWIVSATGCARPLHLPQDIKPAPLDRNGLVIWRTYTRDGDANPVLADAVAARLVDTWKPGHAGGPGGNRFALWRTEALDVEAVDPDAAPHRAEIYRAVSQIWADEPGGVEYDDGIVSLTVTDPPGRLFARSVPHAVELLSMTWTGSRTTVRLRPRTGDIRK